MAREQAVKARKERNAALVEAMLLAAMADGSVSQLEMQTLLRRVLERPEFEGTQPEELNALVESSAERLSKAQDLEEILTSLRERLPDHKNRMLAFGLAAAVAFADQRATRDGAGAAQDVPGGAGHLRGRGGADHRRARAGRPPGGGAGRAAGAAVRGGDGAGVGRGRKAQGGGGARAGGELRGGPALPQRQPRARPGLRERGGGGAGGRRGCRSGCRCWRTG